MMKTTLITLLCLSGLVFGALAQDPNATATPPTPTPAAPPPAPAIASPAAAATASPTRDDDDSLEARIERKVRNHVQLNLGRHDRGSRSVTTKHGGDDSEDLGALMAIPIVGIIFSTLFGAPVLIVGLIMFFNYWKARSLHRTVRMMVERGQPVPPELFAAPVGPIRARSDMRRGVVLMMIGIGLMVFLGAVNDWEDGAWALGMIPFLMGAGYLTVWKMESNKPVLTNTSTDNTPRVS